MWILLVSLAAGVFVVVYRDRNVVRMLAAAAALLFVLYALLYGEAGVGKSTAISAAVFAALVLLALLLPRRGAEKGTATEAGGATTTTEEPGPSVFADLYHAQALEAVRAGLSESYARRGRGGAAEADALFMRLTANMRVLSRLHELCGRMADGDAAAAREFRAYVRHMAARFPSYKGSAGLLRSRAKGAPRIESARPCAILTGPGMAGVYSGVYATFGPSGGELTQALDLVAGLSLGHGHLEAVSAALVHDGPAGLDGALDRGEKDGIPYFVPPDDGTGGHVPGRGGDRDIFPVPDEVHPPPLEGCELVREACESMLVDAYASGAEDSSGLTPQRPSARADNIESLELRGRCAGDTLVIHGHDFGDGTGKKLVMSVKGECTVVPVDPSKWTDTRIEVKLPEGITPGPVGFYDPNAVELYNRSTSAVARRAREVAAASACVGAPQDFARPDGSGLKLVSPFMGTPCPPDRGVNVLSNVGRPHILGFEAAAHGPLGRAHGQAILLDPEEELWLHWNVTNATKITLSRSTPDGPPNENVSFYEENPPGTSRRLGVSGHTDFGYFFYYVTASNENGCDTFPVSERAVVRASKRPRLSIEKVEVTQGIQTDSQSVKLVEGKPTVVRVFARHGLNGFGGDTVPNLRGRLRVLGEDGSALSGWLDPSNSNPVAGFPSISLPSSPARANANDTLNFRIPEGLCAGTRGVEVEVFVESFGGSDTIPGYAERVSRRFNGFTFHRRRRLKLRFIPVRLIPDGNGVYVKSAEFNNPPTDAECVKFLSDSLQFIPATADISRLEGYEATLSVQTVVFTLPDGTRVTPPPNPIPVGSDSPNYDVQANLLLKAAGIAHHGSDDEIWALLVPATRFSNGNGLWGEAQHIPGNEFITPMSLTPIDTRVTSAHELAHCLNQKHLELDCTSSGGLKAEMGETPGEWGEDGGLVIDVAFDIANNATVSGASELMTYCVTRWTSPKRWQQLFDFIGE